MKRLGGVIPMLPLLLLSALPALAQPGRPAAALSPLDELAEQVDVNTEAIDALETKTTLSDLPCEQDEIARFDGTSWVCAPDPSALCEDLKSAMCIKADQDGDSIRPLVCEPRCDCFQEAIGLGPLATCEEKTPGVFEATVVENRHARCQALETQLGPALGCETSSLTSCSCQICFGGFGGFRCNCSECPEGEFCATPLFPAAVGGACVAPCDSDEDCPIGDFNVTLRLAGVSEAGGAGVAHCACAGADCPERDINSNDGQACLAGIEARLGAACTRLPAP